MVFPDKFSWGVSSCGFQFEMGDSYKEALDMNTDWFEWVHDKKNLERRFVSGDFPEDGPNYWLLYKRDHAILTELGLNACRLGIEWSRIFPKSTRDLKVEVERSDDGRISKISADRSLLEKLEKTADNDALNHYRMIINDLREKGIKPYVCLNHFTLPLWIHDPIAARDSRLKNGPRGWFDEVTIIEFWKYAAYVAWKLGDVVDYWATLNEPVIVCESGYLFSAKERFPPGLMNYGAFKKALVNMVVAHSRAYEAIKEFDTVKAEQDISSPAEVGLIQNICPLSPYDVRRDSDSSNFGNHVHNQYFVEAISRGWLDENLDGIMEKDEIKNYLGNRLDWIGVNYYSRNVIKGRKWLSKVAKLFLGVPSIPELVGGYGNNCEPNSTSIEGKLTSDFGWEIYPEGLMDALKMMSKYGKPMLVTENGIADAEDKLRPNFIVEHLRELDRAINKERIDVRGYFHWALTDNYEWASGYKMKFGLYSIDFSTKARIPRKSSELFKHIIETKEVP
jgi:beta-galactosidase